MYQGKMVFTQLMEEVPWKTFGRIVDRYQGDAGVRTLPCAELLRIMAFAQLTWRESLRDIEASLGASHGKLYHMGIRQIPSRSTLSDALGQRDWRIYHDLAMRLIERARKLYARESLSFDLDATVYALDATVIDLCLSLFDWAPFRKAKGAIKLHTLLDLRGNIPAFIHISDGKMHDVNVLDILPIEAGAFYIMDRGYVDYERLYQLHSAKGFFITRAKRGMNARRVYSAPNDRTLGVICDQTIAFNGYYASQEYPEFLRRIRYKDAQTGKNLVFLTNNFQLPAMTIATMYKNRWQVELFFKWIKQNLRIRKFLGNSENAVKTQIWCAVATYVLIAIVKKEKKLQQSLYTLLQIFSVCVFEKIEISSGFQPVSLDEEHAKIDNQLNLFDF